MATKSRGARQNETQFANPRHSRDPWDVRVHERRAAIRRATVGRSAGVPADSLVFLGLGLNAAGKGHALAMNLLQGHEATCPHCWETISLTLDLSVPEQSYIEDCPVCCRPMLVSYSAADGELDALSVDPSD
jgi:hypothetical protein